MSGSKIEEEVEISQEEIGRGEEKKCEENFIFHFHRLSIDFSSFFFLRVSEEVKEIFQHQHPISLRRFFTLSSVSIFLMKTSFLIRRREIRLRQKL